MPMQMILGGFLFALLFALIQIGVVTVAFDRLGLSQNAAILLLLMSLGGSAINLPLFTMDATRSPDPELKRKMQAMSRLAPRVPEGKVLIAVNVGGCVIPVAFSLYLLQYHPLPVLAVIGAIAIQSGICYAFSRPIRGMGIGMPILVAPIAAAVVAVTLAPEQSAPLAYICGTLGVLAGADLLRLRDVRGLGSPLASIGGAGTFDGVFITGLVAVLLA